MPYLRYKQDLRIAARAAYRESRENMRAAAFPAWQTMVANWGSKTRRAPSYEEYLRRVGLHPSQDRMKRKLRPVSPADRAAINAVEEMIRTHKGPMTKATT